MSAHQKATIKDFERQLKLLLEENQRQFELRLTRCEEFTKRWKRLLDLVELAANKGPNLILPPDAPPVVATEEALSLVEAAYREAMIQVLHGFNGNFGPLEEATKEKVIRFQPLTQEEKIADVFGQESTLDC